MGKNWETKKLEEHKETRLKLEKPAKYWEKKNQRYTFGPRRKSILIGIVVITSIFLINSDNITRLIFIQCFDGNLPLLSDGH
jgi:hypothetical protein